MRPFPLVVTCSLLAAGLVVGAMSSLWSESDRDTSTAIAAEPKPPADQPLGAFMRQKLGASTQILEGLCTEDADLVKQGAQQLAAMSKAEKWRVSNDPIYRQFSEEFQRVTEKLVETAEKKNFDAVALRWIDATMACVECHKWARGMRLAEQTNPTGPTSGK
jgi:predicted secreted protein